MNKTILWIFVMVLFSFNVYSESNTHSSITGINRTCDNTYVLCDGFKDKTPGSSIDTTSLKHPASMVWDVTSTTAIYSTMAIRFYNLPTVRLTPFPTFTNTTNLTC